MATPNLITYTASGITFAKANANNLAIANSATGVGVLTDIITPVSFATGTVTVTNSSTGVSGIGTSFLTEFKVGQYLFYYNSSGDPVLAGRINTISSATSLTLATAFPGSTVSGKNCGVMDVVAGGFDDFIVRIPAQFDAATSTVVIPNWVGYVNTFTPNVIGENNPDRINLEQYSNVNNPQVAATPPLTEIPFILTPFSNWEFYATPSSRGSAGAPAYFSSTDKFPVNCFAKLNPYGNTDAALPSNTLYKFFASQSFPLNGVVVGIGTDPDVLYKTGYNITAINSL